MIQKGIVRMTLLVCATVASVGLIADEAGAVQARSGTTKTVTKTVTTCQPVDVTMGDNTSLQVPFRFPVPKGARPLGGRVLGVRSVGLRISHTFDRDVTAFLVSPTGLVDPLVLGRGDTGDNFGSGATNCSGTFTTFSDAAATPIGSGSVPFAGSFKPEGPLSVFTRSRVGGTWRVVVSDSAPGDMGTLHAASLSLTYRYKLG